MMPSASGKEADLSIVKDGRDQGDVWQVATSKRRVIGHDYIPFVNVVAEMLELGLHSEAHRAQVDGKVCLRTS